MDVVYLNRDGENRELRYSLRSLVNVDHCKVFIFGGAPRWISDEVHHRSRPQKPTAYMSTRSHMLAACQDDEVSDPFMVWNDDFYAMRRIGPVPVMHRGSLAGLVQQFAKSRTPWAKGLHEVAVMLKHLDNPLSYDSHYPLIIHKREMLKALSMAKRAKNDAVHLRTLYGNYADLGGVELADPKVMSRSAPFPEGPWLSSNTDTFRSTVEPVLRYTFPTPSRYEKE